jgi:large subunit ribosomal protein L5
MSKKLKQRFLEEMIPALKSELSFTNIHQVPRVEKIVINIGLGESSSNSKTLDNGLRDLEMISGQKPVVTRAKKSIATFKVRQGMPIGAMVTLRGDRMYDFLAKLNGIVFPRIRDFRGLNPNAFDGRGNYNIGLKDQLVFPEIDYDKIDRLRGMNISIVTTAKTDADARALLNHLGFPFKKKAPTPVSAEEVA